MTDLERIARELCINDGFYPDSLVYPGPLPTGKDGRLIRPAPHEYNQPIEQWRLYTDMVRAVLTMVVTGSDDDADLHKVITDMLSETDVPVPAAEELEEAVPENQPAPDWRFRYGLK